MTENTIEHKTAFSIYSYVKSKIKSLPNFWYQIIEENLNSNDGVLFISNDNNKFNEYFGDDDYQRISYKIAFFRNKTNHSTQIKEIKEFIKVLQKLQETEDFKFIFKRINNVVLDKGRDKTNLILIEDPQIENENQVYFINFDCLLERKVM